MSEQTSSDYLSQLLLSTMLKICQTHIDQGHVLTRGAVCLSKTEITYKRSVLRRQSREKKHEGPTLQTLDYTFLIGSTPIFLYLEITYTIFLCRKIFYFEENILFRGE